MSDESSDGAAVSYDPETGTYRGRFDSTAVAPSTAVVELMATVCGREPRALPPLYDAVDPEALDRQCGRRPSGHSGGDRVVEFTYCDHRIRMKSYGIIEAQPLAPDEMTADDDR